MKRFEWSNGLDTALYKNYLFLSVMPLVSAEINDRIATQRYLTPEIPIGSPVMSRTTSEPSGGSSRKMVAIVAGCRSFHTFRDLGHGPDKISVPPKVAKLQWCKCICYINIS